MFNPALTAFDANDPEIDFLQHLDADFPPAIAFFGSNDSWLKGWNAALEKLKSLENHSVETQIAEGQKHAFFNSQPWADATLIAADKFLNKLGFIEGEPTLKTDAKLIARP